MSSLFGLEISLDLGMLGIFHYSLCGVMGGRVMNLVVNTMRIND